MSIEILTGLAGLRLCYRVNIGKNTLVNVVNGLLKILELTRGA